MKSQSVREQLLAYTLELIQQRGYNGFSYRDLAELVGVKTSSIHYYFPAKDDLVQEAVRQYSARASERIHAIDTSLPLPEQAREYLNPLHDKIAAGHACLCEMLSAEVMTVSDEVRTMLQAHFRMNEAWIARLLEHAEAKRGRPFPVAAEALAKVVYGAVQNGIVTARMSGSTDRFDAAAEMLVGAVTESSPIYQCDEVAVPA